jgi:hypothetical protein
MRYSQNSSLIKQHDDPPVEAQNALEKIVKKKIQFTEAETIQQAPSKSGKG